MTTESKPAIAQEAAPPLKPRRPLDDDAPHLYLESDRDFVFNNLERAVALLEAAPHAPAPVQAAPTEPTTWRCFQCDEVFTDETSAAEHFGKSQMQVPACTIDIAEYRRMEETHRRHCEEDTELHREIHGLHCSHRTALMREEEKGYARGLKDGQAATPAPVAAPAPVPLQQGAETNKYGYHAEADPETVRQLCAPMFATMQKSVEASKQGAPEASGRADGKHWLDGFAGVTAAREVPAGMSDEQIDDLAGTIDERLPMTFSSLERDRALVRAALAATPAARKQEASAIGSEPAPAVLAALHPLTRDPWTDHHCRNYPSKAAAIINAALGLATPTSQADPRELRDVLSAIVNSVPFGHSHSALMERAVIALRAVPEPTPAPQALQGGETCTMINPPEFPKMPHGFDLTAEQAWDWGCLTGWRTASMEPLPHADVAAIDADEAFEDLYKRDRRDPSSYDDLAIWRAAWVAGQRALPAGEQEKAGVPTDAEIVAIATKAHADGRLSWLGFEKDADDRYTIPSLSVCHFQLVRAVLAAPSSQTAPPHGWTAEEEAEFRAKSARILEREQAAKKGGGS